MAQGVDQEQEDLCTAITIVIAVVVLPMEEADLEAAATSNRRRIPALQTLSRDLLRLPPQLTMPLPPMAALVTTTTIATATVGTNHTRIGPCITICVVIRQHPPPPHTHHHPPPLTPSSGVICSHPLERLQGQMEGSKQEQQQLVLLKWMKTGHSNRSPLPYQCIDQERLPPHQEGTWQRGMLIW